MISFIARRAATLALTLVAASVLVFGALSLLGGDPASSLLGTDATPEALASLRHEFGYDQSLWHQYSSWAGSLFTGHLGSSIITHQAIAPMIAQHAEVTIPLAILGMLIAIAIAIPVGVIAATHKDRVAGVSVSGLSQVGIAVPAFWLGLMLSSLIAVRLGWLPSGGFVRWQQSVGGALRSLALPAISIGLVHGASLSRYVRSAVIDVMNEDYIRTARSKGLTKRQALWSHGLRNGALPVVTVLGIQFGILLGGTVVIENVYFLPGLGQMVVTAVGQRDLILVRSTVIVLVAFVVIVNLLTDVLYGVLDPRAGAKS